MSVELCDSDSSTEVLNLSRVDLSKPGVDWFIVTPDIAAELLERNTNNREMRRRHADSLTEAIKRGEWCDDCPQTVSFAESDGSLVDGQHRLTAIANSGVACRVLIVGGISDAARRVIDGVAPRRISDWLSLIRGNKRPLYAALNTIHYCAFGQAQKPSARQAALIHERFEEAFTWAETIKMTHDASVCRRAGFLAALIMFRDKCPQLAQAFYESVAEAGGMVQQAVMLRDWMLRNKPAGGAGQEDQMCRSIYCMEAYALGKKVSRVLPSDKTTFTIKGGE